MAGTTRHHRNPALTGQTRSRQRSMQSGYTGLQSGQTWVKAGSGMQVRTAGLKANDDTEGRQMQDANRRRFWQSCLLGLMLLALAGNSHSDDSIINRVEALQAGEPVVVLDAHRSEEHTSELQSRPHLVCRLLLEKK